MELNREQIIKALECCLEGECDGCTYNEQTSCKEYLLNDAISLIKELTEENEKLRADIAKEFTCVFGQPHKVTDCPIDDEIAKAKADTVRKMAEKFSSLLEKEYKENTPEGADHYFKNGALMMWSIADRVFDQIAKELLEENQ